MMCIKFTKQENGKYKMETSGNFTKGTTKVVANYLRRVNLTSSKLVTQ